MAAAVSSAIALLMQLEQRLRLQLKQFQAVPIEHSLGAHTFNMGYDGLLRTVALTLLAFSAALLVSMTVYRLFSHQLRHVPSPSLMAKLTSAYRYRLAISGSLPRDLTDWHQQLGDYVRISPNYISVTDPAAISSIMALGLSRFYEAGAGKQPTLWGEQSVAKHRAKKMLWTQAFTPASITAYEPAVIECCDRLVAQLSKTTQPFDPWLAFASFGFASLSAVGFSDHSEAIERPAEFEPGLRTLAVGKFRIDRLGTLPWLNEPVRAFYSYMPRVLVPWWLKSSPVPVGYAMLAKRLEFDPARPDLITCAFRDGEADVASPARRISEAHRRSAQERGGLRYWLRYGRRRAQYPRRDHATARASRRR